jgi:GntR family transcriptional regulator
MNELSGTLPPAAPEPPELTLDRSSFVPYYRQIHDQVDGLIKSGKLRPGQPVWSEGICAQRLRISKMTVRQAFQALRSEGLLVIEKGKRPVVGAGRVQKNVQELRGFTEEMSRRGLKVSSRLISAIHVAPDSVTASALRLSRGDKVWRIKRLRFADDRLVGLETSHLPSGFFPDLKAQDLEKQSLYALIENRFGIRMEWSEEEMEAVPAKKNEAKLLDVRPGFPLLSMRRTVYSRQGLPVEYAHSLFRGDRYSAAVISRRKK